MFSHGQTAAIALAMQQGKIQSAQPPEGQPQQDLLQQGQLHISESQVNQSQDGQLLIRTPEPIVTTPDDATQGSEKETPQEKMVMIELLMEKNEALKGEIRSLREAVEQSEEDKLKVEADCETSKRENRKLRVETENLERRLKMCQEDVELYTSGKDVNQSAAYIVKLREEEIGVLKDQVADLHRNSVTQARILSEVGKKSSRTAAKCKESTKELFSPTNSVSNRNQLLTIMAEETQKLKNSVLRLTDERNKLADILKDRETSIIVLSNTIKQHEKALNINPDIKDIDILKYNKKIKEGESELGKLQVQVELMTQRSDALMAPKESDTSARPHHARLLNKMISETTTQNDFNKRQERMKELSEKLETLESKNYDLELQLKELKYMKSDLIPKLRGDVDEARMNYDEVKLERDTLMKEFRELELKLNILQLEKEEAVEKYQRQISRDSNVKLSTPEDFTIIENKFKALLDDRETEIRKLKKELNEKLAKAEENEGAALHWKLKWEDKNRELRDQEEKMSMEIKAKDNEIRLLASNFKELQGNTSFTKIPGEAEVADVTSQIKEIERKHLDLIVKTQSSEQISGVNIEKFYREVGELSVILHNAAKERDREIVRLQKESKSIKDERDVFQEECAKMVQDKQIEIRKLNGEIEKMEVEAAKLNATRENELIKMRDELKHQVSKSDIEKAHANASKDNEISKMKQELDKMATHIKKDTKAVADLKDQVKNLELEKGKLALHQDSWKTEEERLKKELERTKQDKKYFEKMVDRLNAEMESRLNAVQRDSGIALSQKDQNLSELCGKIEKIARERGDISTELYALLKEREARIEELTARVDEYNAFMEKADGDNKAKLDRKIKEVRSLRAEIKKMGTEGVKLLEHREKEILEMRNHLKNVLKVMENKAMGASQISLVPKGLTETAKGFLGGKLGKPKHAKSASGSSKNSIQATREQRSALHVKPSTSGRRSASRAN